MRRQRMKGRWRMGGSRRCGEWAGVFACLVIFWLCFLGCWPFLVLLVVY
jgi:hypothetical protein